MNRWEPFTDAELTTISDALSFIDALSYYQPHPADLVRELELEQELRRLRVEFGDDEAPA